MSRVQYLNSDLSVDVPDDVPTGTEHEYVEGFLTGSCDCETESEVDAIDGLTSSFSLGVHDGFTLGIGGIYTTRVHPRSWVDD